MSSSVGYDYSYVNEAAAAARRARERLAGLEARRAAVSAQAQRVGALRARRCGQIAAVRTRAGASAAEIESQADALEAAIGSAQAEVSSALADHWSASLRRAVAKEQRAQRRHREQEDGRTTARAIPAPAAPAVPDVVEQARELVAAEVAGVLGELGPRCTAEDLDRLDVLTRGLADQRTVAAVRSRAHEIRVLAVSSVRRQEERLRTETARARLRALADELPKAERDRLGPLIDASPDPGSFAAEVGRSLERADRARRRRVVARTTAERLRAMGCAVTDGFEGGLVDGEISVAPFAGSNYGLLVRFSANREGITAAVVRRDDEPADRERDLAAQREFCASGLPELEQAWTEAGLNPSPYHRTNPGDPRPAAYDASAWADRSFAEERQFVQSRQVEQARERGGAHS
jgi:hypothetical protein